MRWRVLSFMLFLTLASVLTSGTVKAVALVGMVTCLGLLSATAPLFGVYVLGALVPFNGIIRWNGLENPVAAGFMLIAIIAVSVAVGFNSVLTRRRTLGLGKKNYWAKGALLSIFALFGVLFVHSVRLLSSPIAFILMLREYLFPFLFLFLLVRTAKAGSGAVVVFFETIFWSSAFVATVNILHLLVGFDGLPLPRWVPVLGLEDAYQSRTIAGLTIVRLNHILGLSTQGAGSAFYAIQATVGVVLLRWKWIATRGKRRVAFVAVGLLLVSGLLTVSFTLFFTMALLMAYFIWSTVAYDGLSWGRSVWFVFLPLLIFLGSFLPIETAGGRKILVEYAYSGFIAPIHPILDGFSLGEWLFGTGLGLRSGQGIGVTVSSPEGTTIDRWLLTILLQTGLLGLCLLGGLWASSIWKAMTSGESEGRLAFVISGVTLFGLLGYAHGAAPIDRLFSPLFFSSIGVLIGLPASQAGEEFPESEFDAKAPTCYRDRRSN